LLEIGRASKLSDSGAFLSEVHMADEEISDEELRQAVHIPKPAKSPRIGSTLMGKCENPECQGYGVAAPVSNEAPPQTDEM
jgi:hypothetical protein